MIARITLLALVSALAASGTSLAQRATTVPGVPAKSPPAAQPKSPPAVARQALQSSRLKGNVGPLAVALTPGECKKLGGEVISNSSDECSKSDQICRRTNQDGNHARVCINEKDPPPPK